MSGVMVRRRREAVWESRRLRAEVRAELDLINPDWWRRATCRTATVDFHARHKNGIDAALDVCAACPVRDDCLASTILEEANTGIDDRRGVRGGLPASARRTPYVHPRPDCGTNAGYHSHYAHGETACRACLDAHAADEAHHKAAAARVARRAANVPLIEVP